MLGLIIPANISVRILLVCFLFFVSNSLRGQEIVSIKNGENFRPQEVDSFLHSLHEQNDYVIAFRLRLTDSVNEQSDSFVLLRKRSVLTAYNYSAKSKKLVSLNLSGASLQLIWNTIIQNELFSIHNESDIPVFCAEKYRVFNSHTYEFILLNKGKMKKLSYYDPEYYDNACYGMAERKKIINSVAIITHVLRR
jgi:hypothetical protein